MSRIGKTTLLVCQAASVIGCLASLFLAIGENMKMTELTDYKLVLFIIAFFTTITSLISFLTITEDDNFWLTHKRLYEKKDELNKRYRDLDELQRAMEHLASKKLGVTIDDAVKQYREYKNN